MSSADFKRVREIFERAVELAPDDRRAFVEEQCAGDGELQRKVDELLAADEQADTVPFEKPIAKELVGEGIAPNSEGGNLVGRRIGGYEIVRTLGSGGMSTVFEATQENPSRTVALKTMRLGLVSDDARRRFRYESEVLGRLRHPAIAQVYEAGTWREPLTDEEVPFFAMEYVEGAKPFTSYIRDRDLSLVQALELFAQVCDAVGHGHQLGFIHRDLKPQNVLVDAQGRPKVIDFGIARAVQHDADGGAAATILTEAGQVLGTLQYMAPEQLDALPDEIDTRVDVYALGVMLYELLAGQPPHDPAGQPITAFASHVKHSPPALPSSLPGGFALASHAQDLDWITAVAIAPEKRERYLAVSELAADVRRFLASEPVSVGPPSTIYHVRKFVRRNKALVGGLAGVFVALVAGIVGTTWQMLRAEDSAAEARTQTDKAETAAGEARLQARRAERISDFMDEILKFGSATEGRYQSRPDLTVREAIQMAAARLEELDDADPEFEAEVRVRLGDAFLSNDEAPKAEAQFRRALELRRGVLGDDHPEVARVMQILALTLSGEDAEKRKLQMQREALAILVKVHGEEHQDVAISLINIGVSRARLGERDEGIADIARGVEICRRSEENLERFAASGLRSWAIALKNKGDVKGAIDKFRESLASFEQAGKSWHPYAAMARDDLAMLLYKEGRAAEGEPLMREALEAYAESYGEMSFKSQRGNWHLALILTNLGRFAEAEDYLRTCEEILSELETTQPRHIVDVRVTLAEVLYAQGKIEDAATYGELAMKGLEEVRGEGAYTSAFSSTYVTILREVELLADAEPIARRIVRATKSDGAGADVVASAQHELGMILMLREELDEALQILQRLASRASATLAPNDPRISTFRRSHGRCLTKLGRYDEAERLLQRVVKSQPSPERETLEALIELYEAWGKPEQQAQWAERLASWRQG